MEFKGEDRFFGGNDLFVDLVPKSCWFTNVRSCVTKESWDRIRDAVCDRAGYRCEVCGATRDSASKRWIEAHERWQFDDDLQIQKLVRLVALCSDCHNVTHLGRSRKWGGGKKAFEHLVKVTGMTEREAIKHIEEAYRVVEARSSHEYSLDLRILTDSGVKLLPDRSLSPEEPSRPIDPDPDTFAPAWEGSSPSHGLLVALMLVSIIGGLLVLTHPWRSGISRYPRIAAVVPPVVVPPQEPKYRIYHWKHGTFKCRIDHSFRHRPWACVRIGPRRPAKKMLPVTKKQTVGIPAGKPVDPVMRLPIWTGPWPVAWNFACSLPRNVGKWTAAWRPALHNGHLQEGVGVYGYATLFAKVRVKCPK